MVFAEFYQSYKLKNMTIYDDEKIQEVLNDFAIESFRKTADQDYIAARMSYKAGLVEPFLWSALHAIEKYLKAILLFNSVSAKKGGHDIEELLCRVKKIKNVDLGLPKNVENFIKYLNQYGENRYFEGCALLEQYALDNLDETIWYIRRCCHYDSYPHLPKIPPAQQVQNPKRCDMSGFLEEVIKKELPAYPYLIWNNWFYGKEGQGLDRETIRNTQTKCSESHSCLDFWGQQYFEILNKYVCFSANTKTYYKLKD